MLPPPRHKTSLLPIVTSVRAPVDPLAVDPPGSESTDYGSTWQRAKLQAPVNPYAWQSWHCALQFPGKGYFEVWARATDEQGRHQPMVVPGWNPKGYLNNAMHRIAVRVI